MAAVHSDPRARPVRRTEPATAKPSAPETKPSAPRWVSNHAPTDVTDRLALQGPRAAAPTRVSAPGQIARVAADLPAAPVPPGKRVHAAQYMMVVGREIVSDKLVVAGRALGRALSALWPFGRAARVKAIAERNAERSLVGKVCVVTGANSGIGLETAKALARRGATVVMVCRNPEKGAAALSEVRDASRGGRVLLVQGDVGDRAGVQALAQALGELPRIDVLINNAGIMSTRPRTNRDGIEQGFAVNALAPFMLTEALVPQLRKGDGRVINVGSGMHHHGELDLTRLGSTDGFSIVGSYADSKLAALVVSREQARRLAGAGVSINTVHPGAVHTSIVGRSDCPAETMLSTGMGMFSPLLRTPAAACAGVVALTTRPAEHLGTGGYYFDGEPTPVKAEARDPSLAAALYAKFKGMTVARPT